MTIILFISFGKNSSSFFVVIQNFDFVTIASNLYFVESKKVKSFFCADLSGLTLSTKKLFLIGFQEEDFI